MKKILLVVIAVGLFSISSFGQEKFEYVSITRMTNEITVTYGSGNQETVQYSSKKSHGSDAMILLNKFGSEGWRVINQTASTYLLERKKP